MKKIKYIIFLLLAVSFSACQKDPMSEINDGAWNHERNILNIKFDGQVGNAVITRNRDAANIRFTYNPISKHPISAVPVSLLEISYGATASIQRGSVLDFDNETSTATIRVTPVNGEPLDWTVTLEPFVEELLGTWNVKSLYVYGGTGPEYGGGAILRMAEKPWCWPADYGPDREEDNKLIFTLTEITPEGNTKGKIVNDAGFDGKYADFIFVAKTPNVDVNRFYRTIPKGEGTWYRNYATGKIIFTFLDGSTQTGEFAYPGTVDLGNGLSRVLSTNAFVFELNGHDDWDNIYSDFDKFVARPRKYWIDISKE